jgi:AraC-like DNA-binding protein
MKRVSTARELLAAPVGRYIEVQSCIVWVDSADLLGVIQKAPLAACDHDELTTLFALVGSEQLAPRYAVLHDLSALTVADEASFAFLDGSLRQWLDDVKRRFGRCVVVRPGGLAGAAVTGMFEHWIRPLENAYLCDTRQDAYAFLDLDGEPSTRARIDHLYAACMRAPLLRSLRELVERDLSGATLDSAAAAMGKSRRTLQRELSGLGTTFRRELSLARVEVARRLLLASDDKLETIATALGFSTAAAFSVMFTELAGEAPSVFRERHRTPSKTARRK